MQLKLQVGIVLALLACSVSPTSARLAQLQALGLRNSHKESDGRAWRPAHYGELWQPGSPGWEFAKNVPGLLHEIKPGDKAKSEHLAAEESPEEEPSDEYHGTTYTFNIPTDMFTLPPFHPSEGESGQGRRAGAKPLNEDASAADETGESEDDASSLKGGNSDDFTWENCDGGNLPVKVTKLEVNPHPIPTKGSVMFTLHTTFDEDVGDPLKADIKTERQTLNSWTEVECVGFWGTCSFENVCAMLARLPSCPPQLMHQNMPCKCPFKKGNYQVNNSHVRADVPAYAKGRYRSKAVFSSKDKSVGCFRTHYTVR